MKKAATLMTNRSNACEDRPMWRLLFSAFVVGFVAVGCSSGDFVTSPGDDDASVDTIDDVFAGDTGIDTGHDSGIDVANDSSIDVASDTSPSTDSGAHADTLDSSTIEASADSGISDTFDSATTDAPIDAPATDTCVTNACGGCTALLHAPGDPCGSCGKWTCATDANSVSCVDPGKNKCGGCGVLVADPDTSCCGGGTYKCNTDGSAVTCSSTSNACGGCGVLTPPPGSTSTKPTDPCGKCNTGTIYCASPDALACNDPLASGPTPGAACGTCHTLSYACMTSSGGTVVACPGDDANACGGCGTLAGTPGSSCGCGTFVCSADKASDSCQNTVAGACSPKYSCAAGACVVTSTTTSACSFSVISPTTCTAAGACYSASCAVNSSDTSTCASLGPKVTGGPDARSCDSTTGCEQDLIDTDGDGWGPGGATYGGTADPVCKYKDCVVTNASAYPGEPSYYACPTSSASPTSCSTTGLPPGTDVTSWDYNCDGVVQKQLTASGSCSFSSGICSGPTGWYTTIPDCGQSALYVTGCSSSCVAMTVSKTQKCR